MTRTTKVAAAAVLGVALVILGGAFLVQQRAPVSAPLSSLGDIVSRPEVEGALPAGTLLPAPRGIAGWLNTQEAPDTRGKVVLVDFWTYSCINCIRTLPYLTAWHEKYAAHGLVILGIHTPEFAFEKEEENVRRAVEKYGIRYPVALDNDYATWNAFGNRYWPAKYLFDADGTLVSTHFGEGAYDETEARIRALLTAAGATLDVPTTEISAGPAFNRIGSPETYLGSVRGTRFGNTDIVPEKERIYFASMTPALNRAYLSGSWLVGPESSTARAAGATLTFRYQASAINLVMGSADGTVQARVTLDGAPVPPASRPEGMIERDGATWIEVSAKDLYELIKTPGDYTGGVMRIEFEMPGVDVYAFTFG